jgi:hypothetical protein
MGTREKTTDSKCRNVAIPYARSVQNFRLVWLNIDINEDNNGD